MIGNDWLTESSLQNTVRQSFAAKKVLYKEKSLYQEAEVIDTLALGKVLLLDGAAMISEKDEFIYHEVMGHIPVLAQEKTKKVLVIGAGDGGVIRELCRYQSIESITLVEIDEMVPRVCKEFFPQVARDLDNLRVKILFQDGYEFVKDQVEKKEVFDLIISDSTDPVGMAKSLYEQDFFQDISSLLSDEGIFMCQSENPFYDEFNIKEIYQNLKNAFPIVQAICAPMLIYPGVYWTFAFCSKRYFGTELKENKIQEYQSFAGKLRWHNLDWHRGAFSLPNFVKEKLGHLSEK